MNAGNLLFALCTVVSLAGALVTIAAKSPMRAAVGLLSTILGMAGLFLKLRAEFLAAIQLIVYAGAVVVLFVFVQMLLGSAIHTVEGSGKAKISRWIGGGLMALGTVAGLGLLLKAADGTHAFGEPLAGHGTVEAVGTLIFTKALVVFELVGTLLTVAAIGAIAVARGRQGLVKPKKVVRDPRDFFVGPLMARDEARPFEGEGKKVPAHDGVFGHAPAQHGHSGDEAAE